MKRLCIIVPTYNNGSTLERLLESLLPYGLPIYVVNDGSTDGTNEILRLFKGITTLNHPKNRGKGAALCTGFKRALSNRFDYAITIDSDGQHLAADIPHFINAINENPGALIVGNRFSRELFTEEMSGNMPAKSKFANKFSNFWFAIQTGYSLSDTQTGYRAYPLKRLHWLNCITSRYEAELELMVFAAWHGVKIISITVNVWYPPVEKRVSHFRPGRDFARISLVNTILTALAFIYAWPRKLIKVLLHITVFTVLLLLMLTIQVGLVIWLGILCRSKGAKERYHGYICSVSRWLITHIPCVSTNVNNSLGEDFSKPAIIISNHQSHLDLLCIMMLTPKLVIMAKSWVWRNPLYGLAIRYADFIHSDDEFCNISCRVEEMLGKGYSVVIFPEGTRSATLQILRFHKGAFQLASEIGADILPVVIHGAGEVMNKRTLLVSSGGIEVEIKERITGNKGRNAREFAGEMRKKYMDWV